MIKQLTEGLVKTLKPMDENVKRCLGAVDYIYEYRTIGLMLPRRTGKTTFLTEFHKKKSSLLFVRNIEMKNYVGASNSDSVLSLGSDLTMYWRGKTPPFGLKYSCFLVDEYNYLSDKQKDLFKRFVAMTYNFGMLDEDFYILMLTTPL